MADATEFPREIPRADLIPWPELNPRRSFDESDLADLAATLRMDGMIEPIGVKMNEQAPHWIFAGERRWRASEGVLEMIPVHVRNIDQETAFRLALTENIQRSDLTAMEEAWGMQRYLDSFEKKDRPSQRALGEQLGRTQGWVSNRLRLLKLPDEVQTAIQHGTINHSQARDMILPFAVLPKALWEKFAEAISLAFVTENEAPPLRSLADDEVRMMVSDVGVGMSAWLDRHMHGGHDSELQQKHKLDGYWDRIPEERWSTAPKGTVIEFAWGQYGQKASRAFDLEWWEAESKAAQKARKAREKKSREANAGSGSTEPTPDIDWTPSLGPIPAGAIPMRNMMATLRDPAVKGEVGSEVDTVDYWGDGEPVPEEDQCAWAIDADPRGIGPELFVLALDEEGHHAVCCVDTKLAAAGADRLEVAVKAAELDAFDATVQEIRSEYDQGLLMLELPEVIAHLTYDILGINWQTKKAGSSVTKVLQAMGADIDIEFPADCYGSDPRRYTIFRDHLNEIPGQLLAEAVWVAVRIRERGLDFQNIARRIVRDEIMEYLTTSLSFALPEWEPPVETETEGVESEEPVSEADAEE